MVRSWNITHELVSSVIFHSNWHFGNVQISNRHVVYSTHSQFFKQPGQLIILERYATLSIISGHNYLWIHISISGKIPDQLASWIFPVQWALAFIYTATTFWYCFHFEIFNIHAGWTSDWTGKQKHLERMKPEKNLQMCLAQLLSAITFNSMVRRQDQINLSCMQRKLGGQEINVVMRKQMSGLMKTENMTGRNGNKCARSADTSSLICRDRAALPQGSERMLACSWELQVGRCCPFLWVLVLFVGSEPEEWGCQDWGTALSPDSLHLFPTAISCCCVKLHLWRFIVAPPAIVLTSALDIMSQRTQLRKPQASQKY